MLELEQEKLRACRTRREDWKESIRLWIDWMGCRGHYGRDLENPMVPDGPFLQIVNKSITDVTEDDLIFYHRHALKADAECAAAWRSSTNGA